MKFVALDVHKTEEQANMMIKGKNKDFAQDNMCKGESIDTLYGLVDPGSSQGSHLCDA
jgi:hypothetical protein